MLSDFRRGEADVLIGTQMVTKGHDFPNVALVGVLLADTSLYLDDYRANERTFDLITQVTGRAGRGNKKGCAVIQTYNPEHSILKYSSEQNYKDTYNRLVESVNAGMQLCASPEVVSSMIVGAVSNTISMWLISGKKKDLSELADEIGTIVRKCMN